uniref:Uncharacterized protein n=1 Tax=viral metagenome TaxID=1070528 RepID=A0A6C0DS07_9ZZZZ
MNIEKLEEFMLTGKRLATTFRKISTNTSNKNFDKPKPNSNINTKSKIEVKSEPKREFVFPVQKDSLFWCFYIMKYGFESYETLENINIVVEKKLKIECIELLRKNKQLVKAKKIAPLTHIENCLANETKIDMKTFLALCVICDLSMLYLHKKTYFLLSLDEVEDDNSNYDYQSFHIVKRTDDPLKYGVYLNDTDKVEKIKDYVDANYKIENMSKPIKALSAYKVAELVDIAKKLGIETINKTTNKQKNKNEIYELLIQYF